MSKGNKVAKKGSDAPIMRERGIEANPDGNREERRAAKRMMRKKGRRK